MRRRSHVLVAVAALVAGAARAPARDLTAIRKDGSLRVLVVPLARGSWTSPRRVINASFIDIMMLELHTETMRTTITMRGEALKLGKQKARELGKSLGEVVSDAVLATFGQRAARGHGSRPRLPASGRGGLQPGVDLDDSSALADRMEGLD